MDPWGHHKIIIDKCKSLEKCLFYIRTTIENNLSRLADIYLGLAINPGNISTHILQNRDNTKSKNNKYSGQCEEYS